MSFPFIALMLLWTILISVVMHFTINGQEEYGSRYPTTDLLIGVYSEPLYVLGLFLVVYYCGELVWKTRQYQFHEILDATPVSNTLIITSKYMVMAIVPMILIVLGILASVAFQLFHEYYFININHYLSTFYYSGIQLSLYALLAVCVQGLVSNKYLGMLVAGALMLGFGPMRETIGLEHPMMLFNQLPSMVRAYSDFTGYSYYTRIFNWLTLYWSLLIGIMAFIVSKLWKRGNEKCIKWCSLKRWSLTERILIAVLTMSCGGRV